MVILKLNYYSQNEVNLKMSCDFLQIQHNHRVMFPDPEPPVILRSTFSPELGERGSSPKPVLLKTHTSQTHSQKCDWPQPSDPSLTRSFSLRGVAVWLSRHKDLFKLHFVSEVITLKYVFIQAHKPRLQPCSRPQRHQWVGLRESVSFGSFLEGLCTSKVCCLEATGNVSQVAS